MLNGPVGGFSVMGTVPDSKEVVSFEQLFMSQVISEDALIRLLIGKGIFSKEEFLEMVKL